MSAPRIPTGLKTYRASRTIAGEHKNCGFCRERISVGMPVQFVPGRGCWHAGCVETLLNERDDEAARQLVTTMYPISSLVRLVRVDGQALPSDQQLVARVDAHMPSGNLRVVTFDGGVAGFDFWPAEDCVQGDPRR